MSLFYFCAHGRSEPSMSVNPILLFVININIIVIYLGLSLVLNELTTKRQRN